MEVLKLDVKEVQCICGAHLRYTQKDVERLRESDIEGIRDAGHGIKCPSCKEYIETTRQGVLKK